MKLPSDPALQRKTWLWKFALIGALLNAVGIFQFAIPGRAVQAFIALGTAISLGILSFLARPSRPTGVGPQPPSG